MSYSEYGLSTDYADADRAQTFKQGQQIGVGDGLEEAIKRLEVLNSDLNALAARINGPTPQLVAPGNIKDAANLARPSITANVQRINRLVEDALNRATCLSAAL